MLSISVGMRKMKNKSFKNHVSTVHFRNMVEGVAEWAEHFELPFFPLLEEYFEACFIVNKLISEMTRTSSCLVFSGHLPWRVHSSDLQNKLWTKSGALRLVSRVRYTSGPFCARKELSADLSELWYERTLKRVVVVTRRPGISIAR